MMKTKEQYDISDFYGRYIGASPTDASPIAMGELEIKIDKERVRFRMATGFQLIEDAAPTSEFTQLSQEEVANEWIEGSEYAKRAVGFRLGEGGKKFLFLPDASWREHGLILRGDDGDMSDMLGPTVLYSESITQRIGYGVMLAAIAVESLRWRRPMFPRLKYDGHVSLWEKLADQRKDSREY